jgi:ribosome biogenesis GTPase A
LNASSLLSAYAKRKGFITGSALPDEARSAKVILKEIINGKIVHVKMPPDYDEAKEGKIINYAVFDNIHGEKIVQISEKISKGEI